MQVCVGLGDPGPRPQPLGEREAGRGVRRGEVEDGTGQHRAGEGRRVAEADLVEVDFEDQVPPGGCGRLDVAAQQPRHRAAYSTGPPEEASPGGGVGSRHQLLQQARDVVAGQAVGALPGDRLLHLQISQCRGALGTGSRCGASCRGVLGGVRALQHRLQGQIAGVLGVHRVRQQRLGHHQPVPVAGRPGEGACPAGREPEREPAPAGRRPGPGRDGDVREQRADTGRGEGAGQGQAQQRVQCARAAGGDLLSVGGQPWAGGVRGGAGQVLEERGGRPYAVLIVGEQQVPGVLVQHAQPGRSRAGAEEERLRPRVRPPGQLPRVVRAGVGEGGELQDPGSTAGQRHQQLACRVQELCVQAGGPGLLNTGAVQGARCRRVQSPPRVQGFVLRGPQPQAHQPLGDPPRLTALLAARAPDLRAQHLRRLRNRLPAWASRRVPMPGGLAPGGWQPEDVHRRQQALRRRLQARRVLRGPGQFQ